MELSQAVRTGYFNALNGVISVPVYDGFALPEDVVPPYVLISAQTSVQRNVKRCKAYDAQVTLDIVTRSIDPIGFVQSEGIAEEIENIVIPDSFEDINIELDGYKIGDTHRNSDTHLSERNDQFYLYRKIITYNHIISKL